MLRFYGVVCVYVIMSVCAAELIINDFFKSAFSYLFLQHSVILIQLYGLFHF